MVINSAATYIFHATSEVLHMAQKQLREVSLAAQEYAEVDVQLEEPTWQTLLY